MKIVLTVDGAKVQAFMRSQGLDFGKLVKEATGMLEESMAGVAPVDLDSPLLVEVPDSYVQAAVSRGLPASELLSDFLVQLMDALALGSSEPESVLKPGQPEDPPLDMSVEG